MGESYDEEVEDETRRNRKRDRKRKERYIYMYIFVQSVKYDFDAFERNGVGTDIDNINH